MYKRQASNDNSLYYNTVYLNGTLASGSSNNSYALYSAVTTNIRNFRNNIFSNARSTTSGASLHYAAWFNYAVSTNLTLDYNDYYASGTGGVLGYYNSADVTSLPLISGKDANSRSVDPGFASAGGILAANYLPSALGLFAATGTGILTDYGGNTRSVATPSMGAWEYNANPPITVNATSGTSTAYYSTVKAAFDAINAGTHQGAITVLINQNTTETAAAVLNASSTPSSYTSVNIYPTSSGLSISGDLATPLIDLNGADNVTIDGRVNATGTAKDLVITNTSTSTADGVSTIRFINDACSNTVKYCVIKGSAYTFTGSGILFFSTAGSNNGNDNNLIDHNDITCASDVNRPKYAVYSLGTSGKENDGNTVSNDNIFDFFNRSVASAGIYLSSNNSAWTISGCSFYEQNTLSPSGNGAYYAVYVNSSTGNDFSITGNYIGGSAALCSGTFTKTSSNDNWFYGISVGVGSGTASNIQGNTIQNFNYANSLKALWFGINVGGGAVNIGTVTANTIGAATGNGSVTLTNTTTGGYFYAINIAGLATTIAQNNIIGAITLANATAANATNFFGIATSSSGTTTISNNTIGSTDAGTSNSINVSSAATGNAQTVYGIYRSGAGTVSISGNTISKLTNGTTNATAETAGLINGITTTIGTNTISDNIVRDLTIANANTFSDHTASISGIVLKSTSSSAQSITGNTIYNLSNTSASFAGNVVGLYYSGPTTASTVSGNFIHSLSVAGASSNAASIYGIKINAGATTYANNIISLGGNTKTTIYGIYETGTSGNNNLYFNTVYFGGTLASGSTNKSYALYSAVTTNTRNFRNNIFSNARSTTVGSSLHYAAWLSLIHI